MITAKCQKDIKTQKKIFQIHSCSHRLLTESGKELRQETKRSPGLGTKCEMEMVIHHKVLSESNSPEAMLQCGTECCLGPTEEAGLAYKDESTEKESLLSASCVCHL